MSRHPALLWSALLVALCAAAIPASRSVHQLLMGDFDFSLVSRPEVSDETAAVRQARRDERRLGEELEQMAKAGRSLELVAALAEGPGRLHANAASALSERYMFDDRPFGARFHSALVFGGEPDAPLCVEVDWSPGWNPDGATFDPGAGPCRLVERYGLPGAEVARWFVDGGWALAHGEEPRTSQDLARVATQWEQWQEQSMRAHLAPGSRAAACLTRRTEACTLLFVEPRESNDAGTEQLPWWMGSSGGWTLRHDGVSVSVDRERGFSGSLFLPGADALAVLEADFGPERFAAFWQSDEPVTEAFVEAFGTTPGAWVQRLAEARYPQVRAGAAVGPTSVMLTLMVLMAAAGVSAWWQGRRTV